MKSKFEQLIEHIINDEEAQARELFHNLVVEKSREIYNDLVAEEAEMDDEEEDEELDEGFGDDSMDQTDDMMGDIHHDEMGMGHEEPMDHDEEGEFGGEEHDEGGLEDRVMDLEDALDELEAKFQHIMHKEGGEEDGEDFGDEDEGDEDEELPEGMVREYTEKVKDFYKGDNSEGKGVGSGSVGGTTNTKSVVAGKNDMGGSAKNIAQGGSNQDPDGKQYSKPSNEYSKGAGNLKGAGSFENVPGGNAGKAFSNAKKPVSKDGASGTHSPVAKN